MQKKKRAPICAGDARNRLSLVHETMGSLVELACNDEVVVLLSALSEDILAIEKE